MTSPIIENVEIGEEQLPTFFSTVILGGFVAGNLDALDGVVAFGLVNGQNPIKVLQYIASGAIGASSFDGGLPQLCLEWFSISSSLLLWPRFITSPASEFRFCINKRLHSVCYLERRFFWQ